jgi:hypothetical protein
MSGWAHKTGPNRNEDTIADVLENKLYAVRKVFVADSFDPLSQVALAMRWMPWQ